MEVGTALVGKEELLDRLEGGHAARVTVVTPNRRLAQSLQREFGDRQVARGRTVWETPEILPFGAFVASLWSDALHSERGASVPAVLSEVQEIAVWEDCIRAAGAGEGLMSVSAAAAQCRDAWKLVHAWQLRLRLDGAASHEDAKTFLAWVARYEKLTRERRCTDGARLPEVVRPLLKREAVRLPSAVIAFGFDLITPQHHAFFGGLVAARVPLFTSRAEARPSQSQRLAFSSAREEIAACARWARSRVESGAKRIGIVVPDLQRSRAAIRRALADVMAPGSRIAGAPAAPLPFDISLGLALDQYPIVRDAMLLLGLCGRHVEFEEASRVLRSPFLAGAEAERSARAGVDAELRKRAGAVVSLPQLRRLIALVNKPSAPLLAGRLRQLAQIQGRNELGGRALSAWAQSMMETLRIAGFPGDRALDSNEHQALGKFHEAIGELATLDRVMRPMAYGDALARLAGMVRDTLFQPQGSDAAVQVLGILESAGLEFDHLWVMGLTDEAWPLAERAHPFIPIGLQREAGVPQADANTSLEVDRQLTQGWLGAAGEVVVSHARAESDRDLFASPLIAQVREGSLEALGVPAYATLRDAIRSAVEVDRIDDHTAPPIQDKAQPGGTALFRDQAACPFRAFARYRVASRPLELPAPGLDARDRGVLLHSALKSMWTALGGKGALEARTPDECRAVAATAADEAIAELRKRRPDAVGGRFGEIERARLVSHLCEWLAFERTRGDFTVVANERKSPVEFGGVQVQAKLDRMDRLASGIHALIDYKTGDARVAQWLGDRPDEPQLPMYALGAEEDVGAVVFAHVKAGEFCFSGISRAAGLLPGVSTVDKNRAHVRNKPANWNALTDAWRRALHAIGEEFAKGEARVDPKKGPLTCDQCDQQTFCRVSERMEKGE